MNISLDHNVSQLNCLMEIFVTSNFDYLWTILVITSYAILGLILVLLLLYSEESGKGHHIARSNLVHLLQLFLKTTFSKPAFPVTETNGWLLNLRLALGSNLLLWIATLVLLRQPVNGLSGWFWNWQAVNTMVTIIVWVMRPMVLSELFPFGCFKDLQKILIFGIIATAACLITVNSNVNSGELLAQQSNMLFSYFNSWNIWSNPLGTIDALLVLYLFTITFNTLQPRQRQFEMNYAYSLAQKEPTLSATLEFLRGFWQLNVISVFVIVFLGGNRGLLHYPMQGFFSHADIGRLIIKILFTGSVIHIWRQKQVELTTKQWLHFFLKRLLPVMAGILWLTLLFN